MVKYYEKSPISFELGKLIFPEKFEDFTSKLTIQFKNAISEIIWQINEAKSWIQDEKDIMEKLKNVVKNAKRLDQIEDIITEITDRKELLKFLDELIEILDSKFQEAILPMQEIIDEINDKIMSNKDWIWVEYNNRNYKIIWAEVLQTKDNNQWIAYIRVNLINNDWRQVHMDYNRYIQNNLKIIKL